ncbi:uncharacterized protein LOC123661589 [Melitaea cinxia]|uniref:uncharacterized protein LOC123661589 n=1 Tax=Melitaea cinxia TaxID=113334 RepID=UPI001E27166E|nr:uncharacterized protein LOC123661589 [Melitaea cinxia]
MGGSQRIAAIAAASHAKHYYNHTRPDVAPTSEATHYTVNIFFVSATLCGVLVAVCAACWRRSSSTDKPEDVTECGVYTVSSDARLGQVSSDSRLSHIIDDVPGPPPAYESVVEASSANKDTDILQEVLSEPCTKCKSKVDNGLPSYEAAVLLRDTKL